jgi:hypothetical protein
MLSRRPRFGLPLRKFGMIISHPEMVVTDGFEPSISGLSARRSDQLSHATMNGEGGGGFTRSSELIEITQHERLRLPEQGGALDVFTVL